MHVPTTGQLVTVRRRRYVVTDVAPSALPVDALDPLGPTSAQHLVDLTSVDDDGLGEELRVVWEIEPGAVVLDRASLPDPTLGLEDPARFDTFLHAIRWGAISSADRKALQAPFRSGIVIEDYQLDPVARALQMPRVNLLVADDVGLGKTIESGLVVQELLLRHRARSVLVVCPAGLQIHWRDQMREKFGLEFRIIDSEAMRELRRSRGLHVNPWAHFPRLITSIDYLKRERPMRLFSELLPREGEPAYPRRFDLLIVDEAHNVSPSGRGNYALDSMRTSAVRKIARHFEHRLFLSATPHNGFTESFSALLELLDDQRFHRGVPIDPRQLATVMVRRLKTELKNVDGSDRFPRRQLVPIEVPYTHDEKQAHRKLVEYTGAREGGARGAEEAFATEFVLKLLKKRLFSSPAGFLITLERHEKSIDDARKATAKARVQAPTIGVLQRMVDGVEEECADDDEYEETAAEAVDTTTRLFHELSSEERKLLRELRTWAERAAAQDDSKAKELVRFLKGVVKPGKTWTDERVIVFTEYRATQKYLQDVLARAGLVEGERVKTLYGGMHPDDREAVKAAFQASPADSEVRILIATDAASEGIDLQNHCHRLVHYEIPWNPNRMEQRNGRIDRHGQRHVPLVHHFVGKGWERHEGSSERDPGDLEADLEFLFRAARKVETIREDLGSAGDVIAAQVEEAMLGKRRRLDTDKVTRKSAGVRAALRIEQRVREQVQKLREKLEESREALSITPEHVRAAVDAGLAIAGLSALEPITLTRADGEIVQAYRVPALTGSWSACTTGLEHPHTQHVRPIVFDAKWADAHDDVVLAHLNHRLVQMTTGLLRAEAWSSETRPQSLKRVTARIVPAGVGEHPIVVGHARLVVLGADQKKLHEEVIVAGGTLRNGRFARVAPTELQKAIDAATDERAPDAVATPLASSWSSHRDALLEALDARMKDRVRALERDFAERADKEADDIRGVLEELARTLDAELRADHPQMELFNTPERDQFERNKQSMRERWKQIPGEIERETAALRRRYADPQPRLFPVAISYLVPGVR
ncbi:MAG: DISARM system SNF2-like helicase DrmD [Polyangiales bacterium]